MRTSTKLAARRLLHHRDQVVHNSAFAIGSWFWSLLQKVFRCPAELSMAAAGWHALESISSETERLWGSPVAVRQKQYRLVECQPYSRLTAL